MSVSKTTSRNSSEIDNIINGLNARWNLQLPLLTKSSERGEETFSNSARECSMFIQYLYYRLDSLDQLLEEFSKLATQSQSRWINKPNQERGTMFSIIKRPNFISLLHLTLEPAYKEQRSKEASGPSYQDRSIKAENYPTDHNLTGSSARASGHKRDSSSLFPTSATRSTKRQLPIEAASHPQVDSINATSSSIQSEVFDAGLRTVSTPSTDIFEYESDDDRLCQSLLEAASRNSMISESADAEESRFEYFVEKARSVFDCLKSKLPSHLSFDALYEIQSLALSWKTNPLGVFKSLESLCGPAINDAFERWKAINQITRENNLSHNLTDPSFWSPNEGEWKSLYLSATLNWAEESNKALFRLQINGPVVDKTCRFHRYLGGTRFLILNVPSLKNIPAHHQSKSNDGKAIYDAILHFFSFQEIVLAGRQWRAFYIDGTKEMNDLHYTRLVLVAVSGVGIKVSSSPPTQEISLHDFLDWHLCWRHNLGSPDLKLFARLKLGLSKTIPTVVLGQEEFLEVGDVLGADGKTVMDDGCALMSFEMGEQIRKFLKLTELPTAFQGRISGAKGVWIVDRWGLLLQHGRKLWIQIKPSQLKIKCHPRSRVACDLQRTFEVSSWSHSTGPATVNSQFITVLNDRGVPEKILKDRLEESLQGYYDELLEAQNDPRQIRSWLQAYHCIMRDEDIKLLGAFPDNEMEKTIMLLDAGFRPTTFPFLHDLVRQLISFYTSSCIEKMKIPIPQSTYVYCLPDPCGVLEPGEIHLGVLSGSNDIFNGMPRSCITDCEGLVARNPANLPSDIQRIRFRFHPKLAECRDVAIFSVKGDVPLASLLSGGDYDGDEVWACWDQQLVEKFSNYEAGPPNNIKPEDCHLVNRSKSLKDVFPLHIISDDKVNTFMKGCLEFNMQPSYLGICTNLHQQLVYTDSLGKGGKSALQSKGAIRLAALASFLVDASKQGYELSSESWSKIKNETCNCTKKRVLKFPAYKKAKRAGGNVDSNDKTPNTANVVDFLRFGVGDKEKDRILADWARRCPLLGRDDALIQPFRKLWKLTEPEGAPSSSSSLGDGNHDSKLILREILKKLRADIKSVVQDWATQRGNARLDSVTYRRDVNAVCEAFASIKPYQPFPHQQQQQHFFYEMVSALDGFWDQVKASCLYHDQFKWREKLVFTIAGDKLCEMKARSLGLTRTVTASMYPVLKVDNKALKRHLMGNTTTLSSSSSSLSFSFEGRDRNDEANYWSSFSSTGPTTTGTGTGTGTGTNTNSTSRTGTGTGINSTLDISGSQYY